MGHVEEAEAGEAVGFEEAFLEELLLDLFDLDGLHLAAVGGEFAGGLLAEGDELGLRGGGEEGGEEFFFEDGEGAVEVFEGWGGGGQFAEAGGGLVRGGECGGGEEGGVGFEVAGDAGGVEAGVGRDGAVAAAPMAASRDCSTASRTAWAHQARPLTLRVRRVARSCWASCLSKALSIPRRTASRGMPASRQVSIRAQSRVESMRMEPRRCWKRVSISVK